MNDSNTKNTPKRKTGYLIDIPFNWSEHKDSNLGPPGPKPGALPDCAILRLSRLREC